jgi:hypothetical protein
VDRFALAVSGRPCCEPVGGHPSAVLRNTFETRAGPSFDLSAR